MASAGVFEAEIIATGDELIYGRVLDTNSHWLAQRLAELGVKLRRVTMVGDVREDIVDAVKGALERRPSFLIVSGGLGPSEDDITVESLGEALGLGVTLDPEGVEKIRGVYLARGITEEAALERGFRMARVLEGSKPIPNPVGFASGMSVEWGPTTIFTLPGVPQELKAMFDTHIAPRLREASHRSFLGRTYEVYMVWKEFFPLYREMQRDFPEAYIKNAATPPVEGESREEFHLIKVDIVVSGETMGEAEEKLERLVSEYRRRIQSTSGGWIKEVHPRKRN